MQSVATINSVRRTDLSQQGCVAKSMLILTYPLGITVQHWTLGTNREQSLASLAHQLQNTEGVLAVNVKRLGQRIIRSSKFNLYYLLYVFSDNIYLTLG